MLQRYTFFFNNSKNYTKNLNRYVEILLDNRHFSKKPTDVTSSKVYETFTNSYVLFFTYLCSGINKN